MLQEFMNCFSQLIIEFKRQRQLIKKKSQCSMYYEETSVKNGLRNPNLLLKVCMYFQYKLSYAFKILNNVL